MDEIQPQTNAFRLIGDKCNLSEKTVRNAFSRKPITWATACRLRNALALPTTDCFRIKEDNRGRNKKSRLSKKGGSLLGKITPLQAKQ